MFGLAWDGLKNWLYLARLAQDLVGLIDLDRFVELTGREIWLVWRISWTVFCWPRELFVLEIMFCWRFGFLEI